MVCEGVIGNTLILYMKIARATETTTISETATNAVSLGIVSHLKPQMFLKNFGTLVYLCPLMPHRCITRVLELP